MHIFEKFSKNIGNHNFHPHIYSEKKLGGGTILDLGVYVIQLACLVFNHEKPTAIKALGHVNSDGVDLSVSATLTYKNERTATILTQSMVTLPNEAQIIGTKGIISIPQFWSPPKINLPTGVIEVPLPQTKIKLNYINSAGLSYEAAEVRDCLKKGNYFYTVIFRFLCPCILIRILTNVFQGLKESPKVSHAHSLLIAEIEDELRRQIGVVYDADK